MLVAFLLIIVTGPITEEVSTELDSKETPSAGASILDELAGFLPVFLARKVSF
jgi:hypothetical protein